MKVLFLGFIMSLVMFAQTSPVVPTPPANWVGVGASYSGQSPHYSAWGAYAQGLSTKNGFYSFTLEQAYFLNGKFVTSVTTGMDEMLRSISLKFATLSLHAVANIGGATSTSATTNVTNLSSAVGGGLMLESQKKIGIIPPGVTFEAFAIENTVGSTKKLVPLVGVGYTWH